jgi:hypothetical protein
VRHIPWPKETGHTGPLAANRLQRFCGRYYGGTVRTCSVVLTEKDVFKMLTNPLFIAYVVLIIAAMVVSVIAAKKSDQPEMLPAAFGTIALTIVLVIVAVITG